MSSKFSGFDSLRTSGESTSIRVNATIDQLLLKFAAKLKVWALKEKAAFGSVN